MLSGVFGVAAIAGPSLGAFLVEAGNWRYVFWVNLPISAAAIAMVFAFLRESRMPRRHRIDYAGTVLLVASDQRHRVRRRSRPPDRLDLRADRGGNRRWRR